MLLSTAKGQSVFAAIVTVKIFVSLFLIFLFSGCMTGRTNRFVERGEIVSNRKDAPGDSKVLSATDKSQSDKPGEETKQTEKIKLASHSEKTVKTTGKLAEVKPEGRTDTLPKGDFDKEIWTFDQAIKATLQSDPQLQAGMMLVQEAHADWWTSSLPPNPELSIAGGTLPFKKLTPDRPGGPPQLDMEIAFPIDWFLFAKRAASMESARLGVAMSETEYADLIRLRVTTAAIAYYDVLEAKELLLLAREDTDVLTRLETIMKQARDTGGISEIDCKRVQLDRLQSQQSVLDAQAKLTVAKAKLWSLFGRSESQPEYEVSGLLDSLPDIRPLPVEEALDMALQNRPDLRRMHLQVAQAGTNIIMERRNAFPEVTPSFGYSHQYQECIGDPDFDGWGVGVGVSVPLFDRNQGNRAKAEASMSRAQYELQAGMIDLRAEVREADENLRVAFEKASVITGEQVELALRVRDSVIEAYKEGGYHLIDVLNAENSYRDTKRLYLISRADYWRALFTYNSIIGKTTMQGGNINVRE